MAAKRSNTKKAEETTTPEEIFGGDLIQPGSDLPETSAVDMAPDTGDDILDIGSAPYILNADPRANLSDEIRKFDPHARETDVYLVSKGSVVAKVPPGALIWLLSRFQCWARVDASGAFSDVSFKPVQGLSHQLFALCIIDMGDYFQPVFTNFRTSRIKAISNLDKAVKDTTKEGWADTPLKQELLKVTPASLRVCSTYEVDVRKAKGSGYNYYLSSGSITPTPIDRLVALKAYMDDNPEAWGEALSECQEAMNLRRSALEAMAD